MAFGWLKRNREQSMEDTEPDAFGEGGVQGANEGPFLYRPDGKTMVMLFCDGCKRRYEAEVMDDHKNPDKAKMERAILQHIQDHPRGKEHPDDPGSPYICRLGNCPGVVTLFRRLGKKDHNTETI